MGFDCPNGHGRQPIIHNITANGEAVSKNNPVLARKLACGCIVSGRKHVEYLEKCAEIDALAFTKVQKIQDGAREDKAALWQTMLKAGEVG
jgi:hypothetical protein